MSRSNPQENTQPNPATHIYEWHGGIGQWKDYDKDAKKTTTLPESSSFTFILLEELGCVRGFDQTDNKGVYSNEVKDTRQDTLVVKRDKGDTVAQGIWRDIKVKVNAAGGEFHAALYIAFKKSADANLQMGVLRLKGAALNAWIEFQKKHKADIYTKAIVASGVIEGQKGAVKFKVPKFSLKDISEVTQQEAIKLDVELQTYLRSYFASTKKDQVERTTEHVRDEDMPSSPPPMPAVDDIDEDEIPF